MKHGKPDERRPQNGALKTAQSKRRTKGAERKRSRLRFPYAGRPKSASTADREKASCPMTFNRTISMLDMLYVILGCGGFALLAAYAVALR